MLVKINHQRVGHRETLELVDGDQRMQPLGGTIRFREYLPSPNLIKSASAGSLLGFWKEARLPQLGTRKRLAQWTSSLRVGGENSP